MYTFKKLFRVGKKFCVLYALCGVGLQYVGNNTGVDDGMCTVHGCCCDVTSTKSVLHTEVVDGASFVAIIDSPFLSAGRRQNTQCCLDYTLFLQCGLNL